MCLIALAMDTSRRFPMVVASNRDEFFDRPASRLAWWAPEGGAPAILSGRDQRAGGTWLGLTAQGRLAMVTNVRTPEPVDPMAPSRGSLVPRWLAADCRTDRLWPQMAMAGHAPFNLIAADFREGECFWATNLRASAVRLDAGVHGLSNGALNEPWPKVVRLKEQLSHAVDSLDSVDALAARLFAALADRSVAPDAELPNTGVGREKERMLSPAFIRSPDLRYGTRCSTLIITERVGKRLVTHVLERTFTAGPGLALLRRSSLKDWPPKYRLAQDGEPELPVETGEVAESELAEVAPTESPARKRRVRSLLRPLNKV